MELHKALYKMMLSLVMQDWMSGETTATLPGTSFIKEQILSYYQGKDNKCFYPRTKLKTHSSWKKNKRKRPSVLGERLFFYQTFGDLLLLLTWDRFRNYLFHCLHCLHVKRIQKYSVSGKFPFPTWDHWEIEEGCAFLPYADLFMSINDSLVYESRCQQLHEYSMSSNRFCDFKLNDYNQAIFYHRLSDINQS